MIKLSVKKKGDENGIRFKYLSWHNQALRAYFLYWKFNCLFLVFVICLPFWCRVNSLLTALVNFLLRKMALFPELACSFPAKLLLLFWFRIVRFRAMFLLTVFILANLVALPDEALEFLSVLSSSFSFSMLALMA